MKRNENDPVRNRPSEEGRDNDPNVRDYSGQQPGVSTMSDSDTDDANEKTITSRPNTNRSDNKADPAFDEDYDV